MHWLDISVIVAYMLAVAGIGFWTARSIKNSEDFFLGGRSFGKVFSIFLQFGSGTNSDMPVSVAREVFRNGMSGVWALMLWLFITPFYWFIAPWYRRLRLTTTADYFAERFQSKAMGAAYAVFSIFYFIYFTAIGLTAVGKTVEALTPCPESSYTAIQKESVALYRRYAVLEKRLQSGSKLDAFEEKEYRVLRDRYLQGGLRSGYSYITSRVAVPIIALVVMLYSILGGLKAAVITDFLQGVLIVILSFIIIPFGLKAVGGMGGLHERVPEYMFNLLGSPQTSDYSTLFLISIVLINLVGIVAQPVLLTSCGSARDEMSARVGLCYGNYLKRFCTIGWALVGVLAFALFAHEVSDPDMVWGYMTVKLLPVGLVGLMIAAMLAAVMSSADADMMSGSALFTMNLYRPFRPQCTDAHLIRVGRFSTAFILLGGVLISQLFHSVIVLLKYTWTIPLIFGASFWLSYLWRRVTAAAAWCTIFFSLFLSVLLPPLLPELKIVAAVPELLIETNPAFIEVRAGADSLDVARGLAVREGQIIIKKRPAGSVPIYFEQKVHIRPGDPESPYRGSGKFRIWIWLFSKMGVDFSNATSATLEAIVFLADALAPFLLIMILSYFTRTVPRQALDRFYARIHTPIQKTLSEDVREVELSYANPHRFRNTLLFPGTNWEIQKPDLIDILGFVAAVGATFLIIGLIFLVSWVRWP